MTNCLSWHDHSRLESLWHDFGEHPDLFESPELLGRVAEMVPCDYSSFSEIDELHGAAASHYLPLHATDHADYQAFEWHVHEHPMLREVRATGDGGPRRLSEVVSQDQWHRLGLYGDFFRSMHVEHQVAFTAGDPRAAAAVAVAFNRTAPDFDDRDMAIFRAVRPLFQLLHRLGTQRRLAAAAKIALEQPGRGVTVLGPVGHIESLDDASGGAIAVAFNAELEDGALAPAALLTWLNGAAPGLTVSAQGVSVLIRRGPSIGDRRTVLFEVGHDSATDGLTSRERQVLTLVAEGSSNHVAARQLGISPRTVEKHLERAYLKLEVDNRTAAARMMSRARPAGAADHDDAAS